MFIGLSAEKYPDSDNCSRKSGTIRVSAYLKTSRNPVQAIGSVNK